MKYLRALALGFKEGLGGLGMTYGDGRDEAYDLGRTLRRRGRN